MQYESATCLVIKKYASIVREMVAKAVWYVLDLFVRGEALHIFVSNVDHIGSKSALSAD